MDGLKCAITVCLLIAVSILSCAQAVGSQSAQDQIIVDGKSESPSGAPQVTVTVKKVEAVDDVETIGQGEADWFYYVGFANQGSNTATWQRHPSSGSNDNQDIWTPNWQHTFNPNIGTRVVMIVLMLCDDDVVSYSYADVSDDSQGGKQVSSCDPPSTGYYSGSFIGGWDLVTNTWAPGSNRTDNVGGMFKTSGDFDGSTGRNENDANIYFPVEDNYNPPTAKIVPGKTTAYKNEPISFDGSTSQGSAGSTITEYKWDFGDGTTDSGVSKSHAYTKAGTYTVKLTVKDDMGETNTAQVSVTIQNQDPVAAFSFSPQSAKTGDTITFTDSSTDPDGDTLTYAWDFGDGGRATEKNPTHVYTTAGTFTIRLTVRDADGGSNTVTKSITVTSLPLGDGTEEGSGGLTFIALLLLIILVVIIVAVILLMKKKKSTPTQPPPPAGQHQIQPPPLQTVPQAQQPPPPPPPPPPGEPPTLIMETRRKEPPAAEGVKCPFCGKGVESGMRWCPFCGEKL